MTYQAVTGFSILVHEVYAHAYMYVTEVGDVLTWHVKSADVIL